MVVPHIDIDRQKQALRRVMRQRRIDHPDSPLVVSVLNERLAAEVLAETQALKIGCVWPLPGEADLRPLCHALHVAGREVFLPETTPKGDALVFRQWTPQAAMIAGRYGTTHPDGVCDRPDLVLVPLLAFDRTLNRLGYGGGYYDRTLAQLGCRAFGFALSWQEVGQVPTGIHDHALERIVTEKETIRKQAGEGKAE